MKEAPEGPGEGGIREATLWSECVSWGVKKYGPEAKVRTPVEVWGNFLDHHDQL